MLQNTGKYRPERSEKGQQSTDSVPTLREESSEYRLSQVIENDTIDAKYGFERIKDNSERVGFLLNMHSSEILDEDKRLCAAVDFYFMEEDGTRFKVSYPFMPYFYVLTKRELIQEVTQYLSKKYSGIIGKIETVSKEDLDLPNHLIGLKQKYIKLSFYNQPDLTKVRIELLRQVRKNKSHLKENSYYTEMLTSHLVNNMSENVSEGAKVSTDQMENIIDIREYDVPYHVRVSIDLKIFCGSWYAIKMKGMSEPPQITLRSDIIERPEPIVLAFDIETTKLPLKFPDAATDQIMMISYMIDAQGFLITNREILSSDIEDFEYTPKPEFEGKFTIFNEPNEMRLIQKFFDHIMDVRPHIFVTYNGDFFDWPFIQARAASYDLDMKQEIGFAPNKEKIFCCRPAMHMDCLCWVKRDSYLPVGSQNLKAVAKAKLRYDPVELDPEEMCPLAASNPQVLSNYSVSDAVATYYLYMQYVHPFIFALCTIIPCEPDEVLRKGSGTLCEALLMVEAFHANIIFPNKQEQVFNKLTQDGHVLHQETYVGGHVEALESGVFRADIPCRFRIVPEAVDALIEQIPKTLEHAIVVEEGVPMECVTNLQEIVDEVTSKFVSLKQQPLRLERPLIYHLDVGAMYPNIILTNRLQPCAMVDETICAACDFNKPNAICQRNMTWMMREEFLPAKRGEYERIQQQLELEKFPPAQPGGSQRAFHQLTKQEQANIEKKRLEVYCRRVYKKLKVTRVGEKSTTICQKENSFYVDTVRAFRDRRYEYKGLSKKAKQAVTEAIKGGDASEIKSAKNREVLYDSLQLAHKCILNSFYGYVMRKGARWHSMEMAGIVCFTGANIIMKAREIIEQVGRPLELDTDGIWCILPASFPENFTILTNHEKKKKFVISYPNTILNAMVKEHFTNHQYHELVNGETFEYQIKNENSIFFEVDGPYKAMVLPASKEEGKKLKKRYAVFNFDGSLAELKGFEVKRRGELQLIKNFQSSVFEAFLKGDTLESCYAAVAQVADYWLDVLFTHGKNMPDSELFDLISENRSMSKKLEDYGAQKSSSISTAKRLAEFLGDQMVKDAGLACKYVISRKPLGAPVTERAIPLAIFQAEEAVQKHYLRKWLKDASINQVDIRDILDWSYYIERLGGTIQKIITIPAAMQGVANPVPRVRHPDWLHKKMLEKNDTYKQRRITDMFSKGAKPVSQTDSNQKDQNQINDIEDFGAKKASPQFKKPIANVSKRKRGSDKENQFTEEELDKTWREVLGNPPQWGSTNESHQAWIAFQKRKWLFQSVQKNMGNQSKRRRTKGSLAVLRSSAPGTLGTFLQKTQRTLLTTPWQVLQIAPSNSPGVFKLWALVDTELYSVKLQVPRIYYANLKTPKGVEECGLFKKVNRTLPRARHVYNLYRYSTSEELFLEKQEELLRTAISDPAVEGIYETKTPLMFRTLISTSCVVKVSRGVTSLDTFSLDELDTVSLIKQPYLVKDAVRHLFFYHHRHPSKQQHMFGLFLTPLRKSLVIVVDTVRTNLMPNMANLYASERAAKKDKVGDSLPDGIQFEVRVETGLTHVFKLLNKALQAYKDEKKGPTLLAVQSTMDIAQLQNGIGAFGDFPQTRIFVRDEDDLYNVMDWQKLGAKALVRHYLNSESALDIMVEQSRYFHIPVGNLPEDAAIFGADLFYARHLIRANHVLWCSPYDKPDLGGSEETDTRLLADNQEGSSEVCNKPGWYSSVCVELDIDSLAINTLLQSHHVTDIEGTSSVTSFENAQGTSIDDMLSGNAATIYNESARSAEAFKVLRAMATTWMRDISLHDNVYADFQVVHFYRWLRSSKALLYEPSLLKTLQTLMKKLFLQLVAEFKRLGSIIIYANFNKIVICTKKNNVEDGLASVEFVVNSIRNKELFHSIEISYKRCWEYLVWVDPANYAGVVGKTPHDIKETSASEEHQEEEEEDEDSEPVLNCNWNIAEQLPERADCRRSFEAVIAGYVYAIYMKMKENKTVKMPVVLSQPSFGLAVRDDVVDFAKELLAGEISQNLFKMTERVHNVLKPAPDGTSAALVFVKAVCHVLGLDPAVAEVVDHLKSNLLRLIGVGEFSEIAVWSDTTVSYVVPQIICKKCNHCRDIDLGRDPYRTEHSWYCPNCESSYVSAEIETFLLDTVSRKFLAYNLQDLQCKKCSQIKMENLIKHCHCASDYRCLMSQEDFVKLLETFLKLGNRFSMPALAETVERILSMV